MIYSIIELRKRIAPIARKYNIPAVFLFGSYARNEAREQSDVDLVIDRSGSAVKSMLDMSSLYNELEFVLGKSVDIVTLQSLSQQLTTERTPLFVDSVKHEMVKIYGR